MSKSDLDYALEACEIAKKALPECLLIDFDLVRDIVEDCVINGAVYAPYKLAKMFPNHPEWPEFPDTCDLFIAIEDRPARLLSSIILKAYELRRFDSAYRVRKTFPYFVIDRVGDPNVSQLHSGLEGKLFSISDPNYAKFVKRIRWCCRCSTIGGSKATLLSFGFADLPLCEFPF